MALSIDAKLEGKLICCFKDDKNLGNFDLSTRSSQNFHFDWFSLCKVYNVSTKKNREELSFITLKSDTKSEESYFWFGK